MRLADRVERLEATMAPPKKTDWQAVIDYHNEQSRLVGEKVTRLCEWVEQGGTLPDPEPEDRDDTGFDEKINRLAERYREDEYTPVVTDAERYARAVAISDRRRQAKREAMATDERS